MSKTKPLNTVKGFPLIFPMGESYTEVLKLITNIKDRVNVLENSKGPQLSAVTTTYNELKSLRNNGELIPGTFYRITDYECTTTLENTQSAGHKFDIVLLALSENSLLEEGWAIRNENNLYDVTFSDNVTKKCWIYFDGSHYNIVDDKTQLGDNSLSSGDITLDFSAKTASCPTLSSASLITENLSYNNDYFKNSNLNAWKVWYCLDNDKSRFGWSDDILDPSCLESITDSDDNTWVRDNTHDMINAGTGIIIDGVVYNNFYFWNKSYNDSTSSTYYTINETPNVGDKLYEYIGRFGEIRDTNKTVASYNPPTSDIPIYNSKGVIYRLIDEYGNDCPYDFKNIQYRLTDDGTIYVNDGDATGSTNYGYTFSTYIDSSINDASIVGFSVQNKINAIYNDTCMMLPLILFVGATNDCNMKYCYNINAFDELAPNNILAIDCEKLIILGGTVQATYCGDYVIEASGIYWNNLLMTEPSSYDDGAR